MLITNSKFPHARHFISIVALTLILIGCSITHIVPIQVGRIHQTEFYVQKFSFLDNFTADTTVYQEKRMLAQTLKMDEIFKKLLGKNNWQNLKDRYGLGNLRNELLEKKIYIQGMINLNIYPDAFDNDFFSVEGSGRFFLIREKNAAILMVGNYSISDQVHSVSELERGYLIFDVELFITRIPNQVTYYHEALLKYKIFIDNSLSKHGIYSIDYSKKHLAYLAEDNETLSKANVYAKLTIKAPKRPTKLFDYRGVNFIRRDYQQLMKENRQ